MDERIVVMKRWSISLSVALLALCSLGGTQARAELIQWTVFGIGTGIDGDNYGTVSSSTGTTKADGIRFIPPDPGPFSGSRDVTAVNLETFFFGFSGASMPSIFD